MNTVTVKQLLRTALVLATAAGMTACETQKAMPTPSIMTAEIKLHVVENPKTLKVIEGPICPGEPGLGCIDVPEGETAIIEFRQLTGTWDLTTIWICQESDKPSGRPTGSNCSLTADQAADFTAHTSGGFVQFGTDGMASLGTVDTFLLFDQNTVEQDYWWLMEACPEAGEGANNCVVLDPRLRNGGDH